MTEEGRANCLHHLREASICLEQAGYVVLATRLLDIIDQLALESAADTNGEAD